MGGQKPMAAEWVAAALASRADRTRVLVEEATTNQEVIRRHARREQPGTLSPVGTGAGLGAGATVGIKLAAPERPVVVVTGDGSFVFSSPIAALYAAQQAGAPYLHIVMNNGGYNASKNPVLTLFPEGLGAGGRVSGRAVKTRRLRPDRPRLPRLRRASGRAEDVVPALNRAFEALGQGQAAVLDMVIKPIYRSLNKHMLH